jgi:hypothetical protein
MISKELFKEVCRIIGDRNPSPARRDSLFNIVWYPLWFRAVIADIRLHTEGRESMYVHAAQAEIC